MGKIEYEIMAEIGVLSENPAGWRKELNLISWNQRAPKFARLGTGSCQNG